MGRKDELKDQARALGLPVGGTIEELEARLSGAGEIDELVTMRYVGPARFFVGIGQVEPGDILQLPKMNLQSKLFEPAEESPTNGTEA